jgi:hypothetical protein
VGEYSNEEMKSLKKKSKYKSRLDCVKEAIKDEISKMKAQKSKAIVGLVTFSS